ncbi:MAG: DUF3343 domain-containing protein [Oscillospiraceae bacterium]|nr:DUF3343 domain-containing protein [Oscillospiraceae bacterium]
MKDCLITFRSITPVQRAEGLLRRAGISCGLQRTPKWMEEKGCGYSLRVSVGQLQNAVEILRAQQVSFRKVYCLRDNGSAEEMSI